MWQRDNPGTITNPKTFQSQFYPTNQSKQKQQYNLTSQLPPFYPWSITNLNNPLLLSCISSGTSIPATAANWTNLCVSCTVGNVDNTRSTSSCNCCSIFHNSCVETYREVPLSKTQQNSTKQFHPLTKTHTSTSTHRHTHTIYSNNFHVVRVVTTRSIFSKNNISL